MEILVNGLLDFFIGVFTIITTPIQLLINQYFPDLNSFANSIGPVFNMVSTDWGPFIKDIFFLPNWTWQLVISYLIFKFTLAVFSNVIVLIAQWWSTLVP